MKKIIIAALILLTIMVFTGCADIKINAEITPDNLVTYSYIMEFTELDSGDPNYEQLEIFIMEIQKSWQENGVDCSTDITETSMSLTGTLQKQCADREEAFNTLYEYMTNNISPFESVSLDYNEDFYSASYALTAKIDFSGIIDEQIYEVHPQMVTDDVNAFLETVTCTAVFSLPYTTEENSTTAMQSEDIIPLSLDEPTDIAIARNVQNINNIALEKQLKLKITFQRILLIIAGAAALSAATAFIFVIKKKKPEPTSPNPTEQKEK